LPVERGYRQLSRYQQLSTVERLIARQIDEAEKWSGCLAAAATTSVFNHCFGYSGLEYLVQAAVS